MITTRCWIACEISFQAAVTVSDINEAEADALFTHRGSGRRMVVPCFWNGGREWMVRFAPPLCGLWDYTLVFRGRDLGLKETAGTLDAVPYDGDLAVYKHGFVKTVPGKRYFVYDDGTPFFYLADTHWGMLTEEFDSPGENSRGIDTDSHFRYIVDRRAAQGFTVYQSQPIGHGWDVSDGRIGERDVEGFRQADRYFAYIAGKGLVHPHAQLLFPRGMTDALRKNLPALTRYWVARYAAYPVMWTLGQEVDDMGTLWNTVGRAYFEMLEAITAIDPYHHPTSAHQLNTVCVGCKGGVPVAAADGGYNDYDPAQNERTPARVNDGSLFYGAPGHTWWAVQWRPCVDQQYNFGMPRDYWINGEGKPAVDYEARYEYLYTAEFGARAQAWIAYLSGMCGHAYGGADMWLYRGLYMTDSDGFDGVDVITVRDKTEHLWGDLIDAPISGQMTLLRDFFTSLEWWRLMPDFDDGNAFAPVGGKAGCYAAAHDGNDVYVVYLYHRSVSGVGALVGMDDAATYTARWFDPRNGEYTLISDVVKASGGKWQIPDKPVADDCVLLVTKNR